MKDIWARLMGTSPLKRSVCALAWALAAATGAQARSLEIYFIDVEGGQSTLVVTPDRHSLLIDTGWAGQGTGYSPGAPMEARDANRIVAAAKDAGVSQIDFLLITHFHPDHDGGVKELSELMPLRTSIDHGTVSAEAAGSAADIKEAFEAYVSVRAGGAHLEPHVGDHLPFTDIEAIVVSSAGLAVSKALSGAGLPNSACSSQPTAARDPYENPRSTGVVVRFGKFRFLDGGGPKWSALV